VQFHPEYDTSIMRSYIEAQAGELDSAGFDITSLLNGVEETPAAAKTLSHFARIVEDRASRDSA
jgi:hypothetical protein